MCVVPCHRTAFRDAPRSLSQRDERLGSRDRALQARGEVRTCRPNEPSGGALFDNVSGSSHIAHDARSRTGITRAGAPGRTAAIR